MWLVDHQMNLLVSERFGTHYARIPLKQSAIIAYANALQVDWPVTDYILGNPPFIGKSNQSKEQKADLSSVCAGIATAGNLDFVTAWYVKAARLMSLHLQTRTAFVSTNSITQGEQVPILWSWMLAQGMMIQFAHRTFQWQSAAKGKAAVHCVVIGFGNDNNVSKSLFSYDDIKGLPILKVAKNINPYLVDAENILLGKKSQPISKVSPMRYGSKPVDGGHLILTEQERIELISINSMASDWIRPFIGSEELINNSKRYCLWLESCPPNTLKKMGAVLQRVEAVKQMRLSSTKEPTRKQASTPTIFAEMRQPQGNYLAVPEVSSENRIYLPIAYLEQTVIASNLLYAISGASRYEFGIMTSIMHNSWMRAVCGRLESRYRYSVGIVYNNFPWPLNPSDKQKQTIEAAAQAVLDARAAHPECSLADLYDPLTMPANLLKAHQQLDKAVDAAYGKTKFANEAERVAFLFELYQQYTAPIVPVEKTKPSKIKK